MRPLILLLSALWCLPALAGVLRIPSPPLVADGSTASTVLLYTDTPGGKVKVKADSGKVGTVEATGDGLIRLSFTPPAVGQPQDVPVKVTINGEETVVNPPVVPPASGSLELILEPAMVNATTSSTVRIRVSGSSPVATEGRRFSLVASVGTIDSPVPAGDGTWIARYTPPKTMTEPVLVTLAAVDQAFPDRIFGIGTLPVTVRRSVSFDVQPGSSNVLTVGDKPYGPMVASPQGKVAFDLDLDPRIPTGKLVSVNPDTSRVEKDLPLPINATPQLLLLPLPPALTPSARIPVRVLLVDPAKTQGDGALPTMTTSRGTIESPRQEALRPVNGERLYSAMLSMPDAPGEVAISVAFGAGKAERKLKVAAGIPTLNLSATPATLDPKATTLSLTALLKDGRGTAIPGRVPTVTAEGATVSGSAKDNKDGSYTFSFKRASGAAEVRFYGLAPLDTSTGVPTSLLIWPATPGVKSGGTVTVTVVAVDAWGLPVPAVPLKLGVPQGDGSLPPSGTTDARGVARLTYRAGAGTGLVGLRVEGAGIRGEGAIYQSPNGDGALPPGGSQEQLGLLAAWQAASPVLVVVPPAPAPAPVPVAAPAPTSPTSTAPTSPAPAPAPAPAPGSTPFSTVGTGSSSPEPARPTPGSATPAANRPAPTSGSGGAGEVAPLRVSLVLVNVRGEYGQTSNGKEGLLGAVDYSTPAMGFWALALDGRWWATQQDWGRVGVVGRAGGTLEWFSVLEKARLRPAPDITLGARYGRSFGIFNIEAGADFLYTSFVLFRYKDETLAEANLLSLGRPGFRLTAGMGVETEKLRIGFEAAEGFVFTPALTQLRLGGDYQVSGPWTVHVEGSYDLRYSHFETTGEAIGDIRQHSFGIGVGAGAVF